MNGDLRARPLGMTPGQTDTPCPRCGKGLYRIRRRAFDRFLSLVKEVHRYRCHACAWQGNIAVTQNKWGQVRGFRPPR